MTMGEIDTNLDDTDALFAYADWAIKTGLWDGHPVSWQEATNFRSDLEQRIVEMLFSQDPNCLEFQKMVASLACLGYSQAPSPLLTRDIVELTISPNGSVIQAGFGKSLEKFWEKHKKEIIIIASVAAVATTVVVVAVCTGGSGAGPTAAAGVETLRLLNNRLDEEPAELLSKEPQVPTLDELQQAEGLSSPDTFFLENGVVIDDQFVPYKEIPQSFERQNFQPHFYPSPETWAPTPYTPPPVEVVPEHGETLPNYQPPSFKNKVSSFFETPGFKQPHLQIGGINGINTSLDEAKNHASYLRDLTSDQSIHWTHNQTHGLVTDAFEVFLLNHPGYSPNTGRFLKEEWTAFHERNHERPNAKYLHFCHSQGAIHTRNALVNCPQEIRDRVIVVAIAPAAIVPRELCYQAYNYASKNDAVPLSEIAFAGGLNTNEFRDSDILKMAIEKHENLIVLDPHPDAKNIDHDFQSPTFQSDIKRHIEEYVELKGEYK